MRTTFFGWIAFILAISACSKTDLPQGDPVFEKKETQEYLSNSSRNSSTHSLTVEQLRQYLLQKYRQSSTPLNDNTYNKYGKIGCGYNFFTDNSEELMNIELECQENIMHPILEISNESIKKIDVNPLNSLEVRISMYKDFKKDFSNFFYSVATSNEIKASVDFKLKWLAKASAGYESKMKEETKESSENSTKTVFAQASALIKSKRVSYNIGAMCRFFPEKLLNSDFFIDYRLLSAKELIEGYGRFVLTNYNMGGKAMATIRYTAKDAKSSEELKQEGSKMANFSCSALFGKISGNFDHNSQEALHDYKETIKSYEDGYMTLYYKGGDVHNNFPKSVPFTEMKTGVFPTFDLSGWASSVKQNQQLITINGGGLTPIFKVIREKNIAEKIKQYFLTGENSVVDEERIRYDIYSDSNITMFVMTNQYGERIILDKFHDNHNNHNSILDPIKIYTPHDSAIPLDLPVSFNYRKGTPSGKNVIDLSEYFSAKDRSKIKVEFCKITDGKYNEDITYMLIHNTEKGKRVALSFQDRRGFGGEYKFSKPKEFRYINNLNYIDIYGI
ncbi:MAC/perforin domain-containing protein [Porphyromonas cangingivalis]|uniref:MAC/perforin domain-containing protein n=1 Tax=Porphyromonas cangingivalis TaxID=36874 RepID=UPI00051D332C|nr:MAC/perforin domain-containing protein [Porphyromonas cangingivalis]KGL50278.1 hypothetical protein HQ34_01205 [Porphyromonas cangingivalis]